jgi:hypothetical protein
VSNYYVTIDGQPVGPEAHLTPARLSQARPDARNAAGQPSATTSMSRQRWIDGGIEETWEASLPLFGLGLALLGAVVAVLALALHHRSDRKCDSDFIID